MEVVGKEALIEWIVDLHGQLALSHNSILFWEQKLNEFTAKLDRLEEEDSDVDENLIETEFQTYQSQLEGEYENSEELLYQLRKIGERINR